MVHRPVRSQLSKEKSGSTVVYSGVIGYKQGLEIGGLGGKGRGWQMFATVQELASGYDCPTATKAGAKSDYPCQLPVHSADCVPICQG